MKHYMIIMVVIISFVVSFFSNDFLFGGLILASSILCAWYASKCKKINYIFGFINCMLIAYVSYKNNLYGMLLFYSLVFAPLQVKGYLQWNKNLDSSNNVIVKKFSLKNDIIIMIICLTSSCILAYFLNLIPLQRLAFLDGLSNCINLCAIILMILRYRESWWLWLICNAIDIVIWTISFINNGRGSFMMLLVSIGYLFINVYGIINWSKKGKIII